MGEEERPPEILPTTAVPSVADGCGGAWQSRVVNATESPSIGGLNVEDRNCRDSAWILRPSDDNWDAARPLRQCKKEGNGRRRRVGNRVRSERFAPSNNARNLPFRALPSGRADINNHIQCRLLFKARNLPIPAFVRQRHSTSAGFEALRNQRLGWKHQVPGAKQQKLIAAAGRAAPSKSHSRNRNPRFRKHATPTFREQMPQSASQPRVPTAISIGRFSSIRRACSNDTVRSSRSSTHV